MSPFTSVPKCSGSWVGHGH